MARHSLTRRVRALADEGARQRVQHVGLAHEKLAPHPTDADKEAKGRFIRNLAEGSGVPGDYERLFRRWVRRTVEVHDKAWGRRVALAISQGRVLCGLGERTPTENGLSVHRTYGVPVLPGSSIKGITKQYVIETVTDGPWAEGEHLFHTVFGHGVDDEDAEGEAGVVSFFDALWVPEGGDLPAVPFAAEIATPHFGDYYSKGRAPDGTQSPIPVVFLAAQGAFRLVIEGPEPLLEPVMQLVAEALSKRGVGAKTRAGYGRFDVDLNRKSKNDSYEKKAQDERIAASKRARALRDAKNSAASIEAHLEVLGRFDSERNLQGDIVAWLTQSDALDPQLARHDLTPDAARALMDWGIANGHAKGLKKKLEGNLGADIAAALADDKPQAAATTSGGKSFGTNTIDDWPDPGALAKKKRKTWPNDFSKEIASGSFDEATVRQALALLRANGAKEGHLKNIFERYPLGDEA